MTRGRRKKEGNGGKKEEEWGQVNEGKKDRQRELGEERGEMGKGENGVG